MRRHLHFSICAVLLTAAWPVHAQVIDPKEPVARTLDASPAATLPKIVLDDQQRDVLRRHVKRKPQPQTTGAASEQRVAVGEAVPPAVSIERFPEIVYDEAPTLRTLQYYATERDIVIVEPSERRVVAVID
jgi:hypothetical protein